MKKPRETVIRNDSELADFWSGLMATADSGGRTLWAILIAAGGAVLPTIIPIDDIPARPDRKLLAGLAQVLSQVGQEQGASVALLVSRPGPMAMTEDDRRWARALRGIAGGRQWPVHLATSNRVQVFAPDDLASADAA